MNQQRKDQEQGLPSMAKKMEEVDKYKYLKKNVNTQEWDKCSDQPEDNIGMEEIWSI